jgi:hypothetical protein
MVLRVYWTFLAPEKGVRAAWSTLESSAIVSAPASDDCRGEKITVYGSA